MGGRILLIDGDERFQESTRRALEAGGYRVEVAPDGPEGLWLFGGAPGARTGWDLVVLDADVAGLQGADGLRRIRREDASVPVIVTASGPCVSLARNVLGWRGSAFLVKPVSARDVRLLVDELLSRRAAPYRPT